MHTNCMLGPFYFSKWKFGAFLVKINMHTSYTVNSVDVDDLSSAAITLVPFICLTPFVCQIMRLSYQKQRNKISSRWELRMVRLRALYKYLVLMAFDVPSLKSQTRINNKTSILSLTGTRKCKWEYSCKLYPAIFERLQNKLTVLDASHFASQLSFGYIRGNYVCRTSERHSNIPNLTVLWDLPFSYSFIRQ